MARKKKSTPKTPLRPLLKFLWKDYTRPFLGALILSIVAGLIASLGAASIPLLIQRFVDTIFNNQANSSHTLTLLSLAFLVAIVVRAFANYISTVNANLSHVRALKKMQSKLARNFLTFDIALLHNVQSGSLMSNLMNDATRGSGAIIGSVGILANRGFMSIALLVTLYITDAKLAIVISVFLPLSALAVRRMSARGGKASGRSLASLERFSAFLFDTLPGLKTVKVYGREDDEIKRADTLLEEGLKQSIKFFRTKALTGPIVELSVGSGLALVLFLSGSEIAQHHISPGKLTSFLITVTMLYRPLVVLAKLRVDFQASIISLTRIEPLLSAKPNIKENPNATKLIGKKMDIKFSDITFSYPEQKEAALTNVSLNIETGDVVALVGSSGGGKSTIFNLLLRFYDPQTGSIYVNHKNIKDTTLASLRKSIAFVPQEPYMFDDTIYANIAYGKKGATQEEVENAAKLAFAHDFIVQQEDGYQTRVGERGTRISGGQRQRISIARAILKDAPILLLDEATSALDAKIERDIQNAITALTRNRTVLIIAHRLSTIRHATKIYVLENGRIVEEGAHQELMKNKGPYRLFYNLQSMREKSIITKDIAKP